MRTIFLLFSGACVQPPVDAPEEIGELGRFLFEHFADEDARALEAGLANLAAHLDTQDMSVDPSDRSLTMPFLPAERLGGLTVPEGTAVEEQIGLAVSGVSAFPIDDQVAIMVDPVQTCLESNITEWAGRTFLSDEGCFESGDCDELQTVTATKRSFSVFLNVWYDQFKTYRGSPSNEPTARRSK